jgi:hypothetical protein
MTAYFRAAADSQGTGDTLEIKKREVVQIDLNRTVKLGGRFLPIGIVRGHFPKSNTGDGGKEP